MPIAPPFGGGLEVFVQHRVSTMDFAAGAVVFPGGRVDPVDSEAANGIEVADHVFGAAPRGDWKPTYSEHDPFHETFTTMAFIAAVTKKVELVSGVLILPQRQTGVVAKQAAQVDILSGGRVRLGVGVGWLREEFELLGADFATRGARLDEQIVAMQALWGNDQATFRGQHVRFDGAQIAPRPPDGHVPVIVGGIEAIAVDSLDGALRFLSGDARYAPLPPASNPFAHSDEPEGPDFADVKGQLKVRRAVEVAAAGGVFPIGGEGAVEPGDLQAAPGSTVRIRVRITGERPARLAVRQVVGGTSSVTHLPVPPGATSIDYTFANLQRSLTYTVTGGDFTTPVHFARSCLR